MEKQYNPFTLEGKTLLITGASSGLGRQCAIDCSRMGAKVIAIGRNNDRLQEALILMEGGKHRSFIYDLSILDGIKDLVVNIVSECGKIDGIICAAGIEKTSPIKLLNPTDYETIMKINTFSAFELVRQTTNTKFFNAPGSIVFISSITSVIARTGTAAYSASKGALVSGARVMAAELAKRKIRVNCISPGTILTPLMQNYLSQLSEDDKKKRISGFPLGLGEPSDVSSLCVYLMGNASRWITGQNFIIDGGYTIL